MKGGTNSSPSGRPKGVGLGFRAPHLSAILSEAHHISWFEILSDNFFTSDSLAQETVLELRRHFPLTLHGVGLSLGSVDPLDRKYLRKLKCLIQRLGPSWVSEHLAWTAVHGQNFHDLLPLPYTKETVQHVSRRIREAQDFLETGLVIENVSSYLSYSCSCMSEAEFVTLIAEKSGCSLLLDISNVVVSAHNNDFDSREYLKAIPAKLVRQFHLGGFEAREGYLLDAHSCEIAPESWDLYAAACQQFGALPTTIEWDSQLPPFSTLCDQASKASRLARSASNGIAA